MTVFWLVVALFLAGALLFVLPPLWSPRERALGPAEANLAVHRDRWREVDLDLRSGLVDAERHARERSEIERHVLADALAAEPASVSRPARRTALGLALLLPLASVSIYLVLGAPGAVAPALVAAPAAGHPLGREQVQQRVAALAERLQAAPADREGWLVLARSYVSLARYADAAIALRRALDLGPRSAGLLADLADITGMAQGKRLAGEPARLIQAALDLDPRHGKALALAGSAAFEARDFGTARAHWQRLLDSLPQDSEQRRPVLANIAQATRLDQGSDSAPAPAPASAAADTGVSGLVVIAPELAQRVGAGDMLFVFARAAQGPRMPLAVLRRPALGGSLEFRLDDSLAMSPQTRLSAYSPVVIGARVSRSGAALPQPGDLVGQSEPVQPGASGLRVIIDKVQP